MIILSVHGDGDYGAITFEEMYNAQKVYEGMIVEGVTKKSLLDDYDELGIHVEIFEFGEVDSEFINFLYNESFIDYDSAKERNFYEVEAVK
ncbi:hypothetical protein CN454_29100 [Bacillus cereus]|uniref:hypothetical protein n=1 Tax=Bacillus cereus TaxID=1396 RepID=UPI000BF47C22|nr:hypothetical protein [Bacillus cereus]PEX05820.1 hypothetical protein CN454_29100 [Bacillus cereus]PGS64682.1 hypothetical protein COD08_30735 [Bacillus cereus]